MTIDGFSHWLGMVGQARSTGARRSTLMAKICPDPFRLRRRRTRSLMRSRSGYWIIALVTQASWKSASRDLVYSPVWLCPAYGTIWDGREDFYPTELTFGI
jgi:hypothetical protein